jgi:hypothetical protein
MIRDNQLIISFKNNKTDSVNAVLEITKMVRVFYRIIPILGLIGLLLIVYNWFSKSINPIEDPILIFVTLGSLAYPLLNRFLAYNRYNQDPTANTIITYIFSNEEMDIFGEGLEAKYRWDRILKVVMKNNIYLFFSSSRLAHWIPASSFTEDDLAFLENILSKNKVTFLKR